MYSKLRKEGIVHNIHLLGCMTICNKDFGDMKMYLDPVKFDHEVLSKENSPVKEEDQTK